MELSAVGSSNCVIFPSVKVLFWSVVSSVNVGPCFSDIINLSYRLPINGKWGAIALGSKKSAGETLIEEKYF